MRLGCALRCAHWALCAWLVLAALAAAWLLSLWLPEGEPRGGAAEGALGPFCNGTDGVLKCKSKRRLCGCASGSCEREGRLDAEALRGLDFADGVVRMATFRSEMPLPLPGLLRAPLVWLLGGNASAHMGGKGGASAPRIQVPSHAWSEIEVPRNSCYLLLGGQTSAFRDRGIHAFRLVLHDTTFRFWERERGKLTYTELMLHRPRRLSAAHVEVLKRIIHHGDVRQVRGEGGPTVHAGEQFERNLDQDLDLSPAFVEFPPFQFVFKDMAMMSMVAAHFRLFRPYRMLVELLGGKPACNCVVTALLFGRDPRELLSLVPLQIHEATRARARALNDVWQDKFAPILEHAVGVFQQPVVEVSRPLPPLPWRWFLPERKPEQAMVMSMEQQIRRFRPEYFRRILQPLKEAMTQFSPDLDQSWSSAFALAGSLLEYRLEDLEALKNRTQDGCEASSAVDQLLFCPEWQRAKYCTAKGGTRPDLMDASTVVKETNIAVRRLLYWNAVKGINGETPVRDYGRHVRSCLSQGGLKKCLEGMQGL